MKSSNVLQELARDENGRLCLDSLVCGVDYEVETEDKGKRRKRWIIFSDKRFLVKEIREDTYEDYAELLVEQLCHQVDLPCAHYDLAIFDGKPCVITEDFISKGTSERLVSGKSFLSETLKMLADNGLYERQCVGDQKELNNLDMIRRCLSFHLRDDQVDEVMKSFDMMFALCYFCLNGDLHMSNWSVVRNPLSDTSYRFAPNYDFGSYFRFNLSRSKIFSRLREISRQSKLEQMIKILEEQVFGQDFNRHNSLNFCYDSDESMGVSRIADAYRRDPDRFAAIVQKLYDIDPYEAILNVNSQLGVSIPEDCANWFISIIIINHERIAEMVNNYYTDKGDYRHGR